MSAHFFKPFVRATLYLFLLTLFNCSNKEGNSINYFDQEPPGMVAELFSPGLISSSLSEHSAPAFSPDGKVVVWAVMDSAYRTFLLEMRYENGAWSKPARPSFVDSTDDYVYPSFSIDGKKLFFSSRRKMPTGYPEDNGNRIWEVNRTSDGWENPMPFDTTVSRGQDYANSMTKDGTLYFSSALGGGANWNILKSEKVNDSYTEPVLLPYSINSADYEDGPYISPDGSFLIFESIRPEGIEGIVSLYISFKHAGGGWGIPVNMGAKINSGKGERFARLSPDGKYLFFGSYRNQSVSNRGADIYWIDAKVIDELRNEEAAKSVIDQPLGDGIINALYQNDMERSAGLLKQWVGSHPGSLDATVIYSSILRKQKRYAEAEQLIEGDTYSWTENSAIIMEKALVKLGRNKDDEAALLLSPILINGGQQRDRYKYLANALLDVGKFRASDEYFEKAMAINSNMYEYLRRARAYARIDGKDKAFENLNKAVEKGFSSKQEMENDTDLRSLTSDSRWDELIKKLTK